ncbi:MAG: glycosyltransferase family 9 protein [Bacteroidetes bacterium]|nr:glycosyltransferase family 9 protein [Bacteroidota bacterium]
MKKILVIQTASIGDVILTTPVIEALHHSFPDASIDILVKSGMEGLFRSHPFLHEILVWNKKNKKLQNFLRILCKTRKTKYDAVINVQRFALTGILTSLSGSKVRIGFSKNPFSIFFTQSILHIIKKGMHETERNLMLTEPLTGPSKEKPRLYPIATDTAKTAGYKSGIYYTISPASLWFTKQYPAEKWIEFISYIPHSCKVYFLGSSEDATLCENIIRQSGHPGCISLAGKLGFLESASLMKDARMNFTNDSAPMHLASAVNAPVTVIYCSTVPEFGFGPLSDESRIVEIKDPLSCRPCGLHGYRSCPEKHFRCATDIDVDQLASGL